MPEVLEELGTNGAVSSHTLSNRHRNATEEQLQLLRDMTERRLTNEEVAVTLGISEKTLRNWRKRYNIPSQLGIRRVLTEEEAARFRQMCHDGHSLSEIARTFGVDNRPHILRRYREELGITDNEYRLARRMRDQHLVNQYDEWVAGGRVGEPPNCQATILREIAIPDETAARASGIKANLTVQSGHARFRIWFYEFLTQADMQEAYNALMDGVRAREEWAVKELLNRAMGKPTEGAMNSLIQEEMAARINLDKVDDQTLGQLAEIMGKATMVPMTQPPTLPEGVVPALMMQPESEQDG